ncbi:MAG: hypothetical protein AAFQ37_14480, partial [Bacteroidota bacterium]
MYITLLAIVIAGFGACNPATSIGAGFIPEENFILSSENDFALAVSTVHYEDIINPNDNRLLIGRHRDSDLGIIESRAFFQLQVD